LSEQGPALVRPAAAYLIEPTAFSNVIAYFEDAEESHAPRVASPKKYERPIALSLMRERMRGFSPSQFFA